MDGLSGLECTSACRSDTLGDQPLERAREALPADHPYWGVLWARLWNCKPGHTGLVADAETWLASDLGRQSRHWSFVWEKLFRYKKGRRLEIGNLEESATSWLRDNEYEPDWNYVFRPLAATAPSRVPWGSALRLIDEYAKNRNWAYVFEIVADRAQAFDAERHHNTLKVGWQWLCTPETQDTAEWRHVWEKLVDVRGELPPEIERAALLGQGHAWLEGREDAAEWTHVWQKLVDMRGELPPEIERAALLGQGHAWLEGREDAAEWNYVWQKLVDMRGELPPEIERAALLGQGHAWLEGREDAAEWNYVWQKLVDVRDELPEIERAALLGQGHAWLEGREDAAEWNYVWQKLVDVRDELPEIERAALLGQGHARLEGREDTAEWNYVWKKLVDVRDELPAEIDFGRLIALGHGWLLGREASDEWTLVWEKLLSHDLDQGWQWLRQVENMSHESWTFVWQALEKRRFEPSAGEPNLKELAWQWLQRPENVERGEWDKIWETCFKNRYREPAFLTAGSDWVLSNGTLPQACGLAICLLGVAKERAVDWAPPGNLIEWARNWQTANHENPSWSYLWGFLWAIDRSVDTARLVPPWLTSGPPEKRAGWAIYKLARSGDPEVVAELRAWLDAHATSPLAPIIRKALAQCADHGRLGSADAA